MEGDNEQGGKVKYIVLVSLRNKAKQIRGRKLVLTGAKDSKQKRAVLMNKKKTGRSDSEGYLRVRN